MGLDIGFSIYKKRKTTKGSYFWKKWTSQKKKKTTHGHAAVAKSIILGDMATSREMGKPPK